MRQYTVFKLPVGDRISTIRHHGRRNTQYTAIKLPVGDRISTIRHHGRRNTQYTAIKLPVGDRISTIRHGRRNTQYTAIKLPVGDRISTIRHHGIPRQPSKKARTGQNLSAMHNINNSIIALDPVSRRAVPNTSTRHPRT